MAGENSDYGELIKSRILDRDNFVRATFSGSRPGASVEWTRVVIRPVLLKDERFLQFSLFDGKKDITKNYSGDEIGSQLTDLLALSFRNFHVESRTGSLQINLSKKGKPMISESKTKEPDEREINLAHDREKNWILPVDKPEPFLQMVGIMTQDGKVKADMQHKFRQINEYLRLVEQTGLAERSKDSPIRVLDCGCGNAYLTFATYHYLANVLGFKTWMVGIDVQANLLQKHVANAMSLGWDGLSFEAASIIDHIPEAAPDVVLALHACDTATDDAIAQGIKWGSQYVITAPCCHHNLQEQLNSQTCSAPFNSVFRYGILGERVGDILTDTFRALILRIMGYRTDVVQFVSPEDTAKNLMIRASAGLRRGDPQFIKEYRELKEFWHVTPYLEQLLGDEFTGLVDRAS